MLDLDWSWYYLVTCFSIFQPADKTGRISSLSRMSNNAAMLFGAMISGFLVLSLGISVLFILVAVIMICFVGIAAFLWRLR